MRAHTPPPLSDGYLCPLACSGSVELLQGRLERFTPTAVVIRCAAEAATPSYTSVILEDVDAVVLATG